MTPMESIFTTVVSLEYQCTTPGARALSLPLNGCETATAFAVWPIDVNVAMLGVAVFLAFAMTTIEISAAAAETGSMVAPVNDTMTVSAPRPFTASPVPSAVVWMMAGFFDRKRYRARGTATAFMVTMIAGLIVSPTDTCSWPLAPSDGGPM